MSVSVIFVDETNVQSENYDVKNRKFINCIKILLTVNVYVNFLIYKTLFSCKYALSVYTNKQASICQYMMIIHL